MAVTASIIFQGRNRLSYLLSQDGAAGTTLTITTTGAATPDLRTDSIGGLMTALARAFTDGLGTFAAGALTQAQARALWLSDWVAGLAGGPGASPGPMQKTAECVLTPATGAVVETWLVDANIDGSGNPTLTISAQAGAGTAILDVFVPNQIGA